VLAWKCAAKTGSVDPIIWFYLGHMDMKHTRSALRQETTLSEAIDMHDQRKMLTKQRRAFHWTDWAVNRESPSFPPPDMVVLLLLALYQVPNTKCHIQ